MPAGLPRIVGDVVVALPSSSQRIGVEEVLHRLRHGVDVAGRAGDRLGQHAASPSKTPAERSPASRTEVENAVRTRVCACSSTTAMRRLHMICMWICERAVLGLDIIDAILRSLPQLRILCGDVSTATRPPAGMRPSCNARAPL